MSGGISRPSFARSSRRFEQIFAWHGEGLLRPLVSQVYPLERFAEAQDAVLERRSVGKVVLLVRQEEKGR